MHIDNFNCERSQLKQCYTILNRNRYNIKKFYLFNHSACMVS